MSDSWYREPLQLEPFKDGFGLLWTFDGRCLNPAPKPEPSFLDEWPEDLQFQALVASYAMAMQDLLVIPANFTGIINGRVD